MSVDLHTWAARWHVPPEALAELAALSDAADLPHATPGSEAAASNLIRLAASQRGDLLLFRNNVGALLDKRGVPLRYGLANDSKQLNAICKSADLIGVKRVAVASLPRAGHVGVFASVEVKHPGWKYTGTKHEIAQKAWAMRIQAMGGVAVFATGPEGLP